ncbi:hypothetical protein Tsubulata_048647, partial [Turnera subulata]
DGGTLKAFLATWSSISRGDVKGVVYPALSEASHFFPPRSSFPQNHLSLMENLWFTEANYITRRFVFDAKSIASLKAKAANGNPEAKTSRIVTLSCFIWKCSMSATKALSSGSPKLSILVEAVNLRHRTKPPMSDGSIGDNFWWAVAMAHPTDDLAFIATWSSISRGDVKGVVFPALSEASRFFPPRTSFPQNHLSLMENLWFTEANYITRRFVFDAKSIASLKAKAANGIPEAKTSRIETLSCFIWKCCMSATKALSSGSPKPSILVEAVNLRHRTKPPMSDASIGDNFWWAIAMAHPTDEKRELHDLVNLLNDAISLYDGDYTQSLQGEEGVETMEECCNQLEDFINIC